MTKRMLIDSTQDEETRVVVINGNKLEDVEFETCHRKQIKGNIYLAKVMRVEPSLQACFVDYGGNKHGFLAFGEIHPDYYNIAQEQIDAIDKEVNDIIEAKKTAIKEREAERERIRAEKAAAYAKKMAEKALLEAQATSENASVQTEQNEEKPSENNTPVIEDENVSETEVQASEQAMEAEHNSIIDLNNDKITDEEIAAVAEEEGKKHPLKKRVAKKRIRKKKEELKEELKVLAEDIGMSSETISEDMVAPSTSSEENEDFCPQPILKRNDDDDDDDTDDDDDELEMDFELQRKLLRARKLYYSSKIQDVIKEGQILLVQVVKEERGNKGAALTTYLSLAGRYCVLMPNRIKSGGVSRKITNVADRKRLKEIVKSLPLSSDMSLIVRTAGEEKTRADIVRDYNYLIRSWNLIRIDALKNKAPIMIHEEGNLIKRALRDIYTKDISEVIVAGDEGYKTARDFIRILSPSNLKKIKNYRNDEMPLFQRFQVEGQLDKLHDPNAQLESGGYLVINPTEALVSIDVNSGRATKEKDLEETALKTNLEACDEIARQLRLRNLAGLVVIDFIDMDDPANNHSVEKRMKEALKKDRSRIQIAKMSCFGLLEISRQRMHSSFMESNYQVCPYCHGQGMIRTMESSTVYVLRGIEEEGIKNRSTQINIFVPSDVAIHLLNHKRQALTTLEQKYKMSIIICADDSIKHINDYRIERIKAVSSNVIKEETVANNSDDFEEENVWSAPVIDKQEDESEENNQQSSENQSSNRERGKYRRRDRRNRRNRDFRRNNNDNTEKEEKKTEAVILYDSHEEKSSSNSTSDIEGEDTAPKKKTAWWKKLIKS